MEILPLKNALEMNLKQAIVFGMRFNCIHDMACNFVFKTTNSRLCCCWTIRALVCRGTLKKNLFEINNDNRQLFMWLSTRRRRTYWSLLDSDQILPCSITQDVIIIVFVCSNWSNTANSFWRTGVQNATADRSVILLIWRTNMIKLAKRQKRKGPDLELLTWKLY